jgi:hypothetical protein
MYVMDILYILWQFGILLPPFGTFYKDKSGNPAGDKKVLTLIVIQTAEAKTGGSQAKLCYKRTNFLPFLVNGWKPGLPDFSRYNLPNRGKIYQNDHEIFQMAIKYTIWK